VVFLTVTALASSLFWLAKVLPLLHKNLHAVIAVTFFYAPVLAERWRGRSFDFRHAGMTMTPVRPNLAVFGVAIALTFPLFVAGFFWFYDGVCGESLASPLARFDQFCPAAATWRGWANGHFQLPPGTLVSMLNQIVVVALPEEVFFRGYLMGKLEERWPPRMRLLGAAVGWALPVSALLFAFGHFLVDFNPQRLAVFFPGLVFGWMRARARSLAAGTLFHASCNVLSDVLHASFFG
jgi:membrane protease YdiL (CAAX protease family)